MHFGVDATSSHLLVLIETFLGLSYKYIYILKPCVITKLYWHSLRLVFLNMSTLVVLLLPQLTYSIVFSNLSQGYMLKSVILQPCALKMNTNNLGFQKLPGL